MEAVSMNTYIFDPESATELARLINQDRVVTEAMGEALSSVPDAASLHNILDLGCGPGGWGLDAAFVLPLSEVEGVDVSRKMVDYANARARTQQLSNVSFGVMDITQPLDFPNASFDLVNARFLTAVLKREVWPGFLAECTRVLRPGGYLRLTEAADFGMTTSEAVNHLMDLTHQALYQLGYGATRGSGLGLLPMLLSFFKQLGYQEIQVLAHALDYSAKTEAWADTYHNIDIISYQIRPMLLKLGFMSEKTGDLLHHQALIEMQQNGFSGIGHVTTVIGQKPGERPNNEEN
jgi:ubiquinone/menaquinone biosynthesis C-methylase UbiE